MRGSLAEFVDIQEWASSTLKNNAEFNQFCVDTIGSELSFYSSFPFKEEVREDNLPAIIFYSEMMEGSNNSTADFFREWKLPFVVQIIPRVNSELVNGVESWTSTQDIKKIAYKACEILEKYDCTIGSGKVRFLAIESLTTTDIDEADDLQAQVFVQFGEDNGL